MAEEREKRDIRQEVTERVIAAMENGTAPWQCPHEGGPRSGPVNAVTGKPYTGGNHIWLAMVQPTADPRWATFAQAKAAGWMVKKGEHGVPIEVWKTYEKQDTVDLSKRTEKERTTLQKAGISDGQEITEQKRFAKTYTVFHASQIEGIPPLEMDPEAVHAFDLHAVGEKLFDKTAQSAPVHFDSPGRGFYSPKRDEIHLSPKDQFLDAGHLYATAAHEIAHSTMHPSRLNRERYQEWEQGTAGDKTLSAKEELRAEMASYMLSEKTGIPHHPENHESYVAGWVSILRDSKNELYQAARDAEKIADYVIEQQKLLDISAPEKTTQQEVLPALQAAKDAALPGVAPRITVSPETVALADQIARVVRSAQAPQQEVPPALQAVMGATLHLNPADLIQFHKGNGEFHTGIVLREVDNRDADKSVFFQYKEITPGKDGKPVIQPAGNSLGVVQKSDISVQIPNAVPGIEKLDMQSKGFEKDAERIPGIKAALEYRVDSVMRQNNLTFENMEKESEMEKQVYHRVILTHRKDLTARVLREPVDPDKPILECVNHPRQEISGVLKDFSKSEFILKTEEFGDVRVETHKRMFDGREEELRAAVGKPVDISIDNTGKNLSMAVHQGDGVSIMQDHFQTPVRPVGLLPMVQMNRADAQPITGKLTHIHDTNMLELKDAKGRSALVVASDPDKAHQAEIKKMVGHNVTVTPGRTLQVEDLSVKKAVGVSR
jgi:antirestriction protein ArdC